MTKKQKIIDFAKDHPFATNEEIAAQCNTTERYVRTILSEAEISLLEIRKEAYQELRSEYERLREDYQKAIQALIADELDQELSEVV